MGTYSAVHVNGDWGIINKVPVRAEYHEIIYGPTILGIDYFDRAHHTLSRIDCKVKIHRETLIINMAIICHFHCFSLRLMKTHCIILI